jgi:hypothetical protein
VPGRKFLGPKFWSPCLLGLVFSFRAIDSLHGNELCLFEEQIRMIFKKLQPAFIGKVNYIDENIFHDFSIEANRSIDQVIII